MGRTDADRARRYRDRHRQPVAPRPCAECGTEFVPKRRHALTCSNLCRTRKSRRLRGGDA